MADLEDQKMSNVLLEEINNLIETYCPQCGMKNEPNNFCRICKKCKDLNMFRCLHQDCDKSYKHVQNVRAHIKKSHLRLEHENSHMCPSCCKKFSHLNILNEHLKICLKRANLVCKHCNFKTDWPKSLRRHMLKWHGKLSKNIHKCKKCNKVFLDAKGLNVHKTRFCGSNSKSNKKKRKDETHIEIGGKRNKSTVVLNKGLNKFRMYCRICNKKSKDLQLEKIKECEECEVSMAVYCKKCELRFRKINAILEHSKMDCKPKKILCCNDCKYTSHKKSALSDHIEAMHLCEKRCCTKCGNSYKLLRHLKKHQQCCQKLTISEHPNLTEDPDNLDTICKIEVEESEVIDEIFLLPCENPESLASESDVEGREILDKTQNIIKIEKKSMESDTHLVGSAIFTEADYVDTDENKKKEVNRFIEICCPACDTKYGPNDSSILCIKCKKPNEFHCLHPYCYLHFTQLHGLKLHIQHEHLVANQPEEIHKCQTCSKSFRYMNNLEEHKIICLNEVIQHRDNEVNSPGHLNQNDENSINETNTCKNCNNNFLLAQSLKKHEKQCKKPQRIVICSDCNHKVCKRLRSIASIMAQQKKKGSLLHKLFK